MTDGLLLETGGEPLTDDDTLLIEDAQFLDPADDPLATPPDPLKPFGCDICGQGFTRKDRLNTHRKAKHNAGPVAPGPIGRPPGGSKDTAPGSVKIQIGGNRPGKVTADRAKVEAAASQLVTMVAGAVLLAGQPADAMDLQSKAEAWATSVGELSEYEKWIAKLFTATDDAGRLMAWLGFIMATGGLVMPIMLRHGALPENIRGLAESVFTNGQQLGGTSSEAV
jgi:hypothetical protein